jgi:hypothetical protein
MSILYPHKSGYLTVKAILPETIHIHSLFSEWVNSLCSMPCALPRSRPVSNISRINQPIE